MKKASKFIALVISVVMSFGLMTFLAGCNGDGGEVNVPEPEAKVYSVTLQHNDADVAGGVVSVELSAGTVTFTADVRKDADADGTVTYSSSTPEVATISASGVVTLISKGETVITATAGGKSHEVVLVVNDNRVASSHNIIINGGTASVTKAAEGTLVTVSANIPQHKTFTEWQFSENVSWVSGNVFKMPDGDVEVTAVFDDMLYTLNIVGAKVVKADEVVNPDGTDGGYTADGNTAEYAITQYGLAYDTEIDLEAIEEPEGKMFVGWDYGSADNRAGENGVSEYSFNMPDSTLTVWAVFSDLKSTVLTAGGISGFTTSKITNGVPAGSFPDEAFEGLSGFRVTIPSGATTPAGYTNENIQGTSFDTVSDGSKLVKCIFRNNSSEAITVEFGASYYGIIAASGPVTIQGGETKKVFFVAGMGIREPWMCFAVRENNARSAVQLDMVVGTAPMYPSGDKLLKATNAEYVKLCDLNDDLMNKAYQASGWMREHQVNNRYGTTYVANYAHSGCYTTLSGGTPSYLYAPIVNMPKFDAAAPTQTIYGKYINLANNPDVSISTTIKVIVSTSSNANDASAIVASFDISSDKSNEMILFKLEWERTQGTNYYFSIVKEKLDATGTYDSNSFCLQLTYNNVLGYEEA